MKELFSTTPAEMSFPVPDLRFDNCHPRFWNGNSTVKSHFWNSMSSLLPNIEFCAIRSLLPLMTDINEHKLLQEVRLFCDQENAHGSLHSQFNRQHLHVAYPFLKILETWERHCFSWMSKIFPRRLFLSLFVAVEHWTAAFAQHGLSHPHAWFADCDATMFRLWEWHAVEELAHKSVCHDVYRYFKGGFLTQVLGMILLLLLVMLPGLCLRLAYLFVKDKVWWHANTYRELLVYLFGKLGVLRLTFSDFLCFFHPQFRPWHIDSMPIITMYRTQYQLSSDTAHDTHIASHEACEKPETKQSLTIF